MDAKRSEQVPQPPDRQRSRRQARPRRPLPQRRGAAHLATSLGFRCTGSARDGAFAVKRKTCPDKPHTLTHFLMQNGSMSAREYVRGIWRHPEGSSSGMCNHDVPPRSVAFEMWTFTRALLPSCRLGARAYFGVELLKLVCRVCTAAMPRRRWTRATSSRSARSCRSRRRHRRRSCGQRLQPMALSTVGSCTKASHVGNGVGDGLF